MTAPAGDSHRLVRASPGKSLREWVRTQLLEKKGGEKRGYIPRLRYWSIFLAAFIVSYGIGALPPVDQASALIWDGVESLLMTRDRTLDDDVRVVLVSEAEFESWFAGQSPLDRSKLAAVLVQILQKDPARVFVDLETKPSEMTELLSEIARIAEIMGAAFSLAEIEDKLVWADAPVDWPSDQRALDQLDAKERVCAQPMFLQTEPDNGYLESNSRAKRNGPFGARSIAALGPALDGRTREVCTCFTRIDNRESPRLHPEPVETFIFKGAKQVYSAASNCGSTVCSAPTFSFTSELCEPVQPRFLAILPLPARTIISLEELLAGNGSGLKGKVVFLGGDYFSRDRFYLPDGNEYPGVEVLAAASMAIALGQTIENWLIVDIAAGIVMGLLVSFLIFRFRPWHAFGLSVLAALFGCAFFVRLSFELGSILSVAGVMLGVGISHGIEATEQLNQVVKDSDEPQSETTGSVPPIGPSATQQSDSLIGQSNRHLDPGVEVEVRVVVRAAQSPSIRYTDSARYGLRPEPSQDDDPAESANRGGGGTPRTEKESIGENDETV